MIIFKKKKDNQDDAIFIVSLCTADGLNYVQTIWFLFKRENSTSLNNRGVKATWEWAIIEEQLTDRILFTFYLSTFLFVIFFKLFLIMQQREKEMKGERERESEWVRKRDCCVKSIISDRDDVIVR